MVEEGVLGASPLGDGVGLPEARVGVPVEEFVSRVDSRFPGGSDDLRGPRRRASLDASPSGGGEERRGRPREEVASWYELDGGAGDGDLEKLGVLLHGGGGGVVEEVPEGDEGDGEVRVDVSEVEGAREDE